MIRTNTIFNLKLKVLDYFDLLWLDYIECILE